MTSCGKDEDKGKSPDALVGRWVSTSVVAAGCTEPDHNGTKGCSSGGCVDLTIRSNGSYSLTGAIIDGGKTESGAITATAATFSLCETRSDCSKETASTYTITGKIMVVVFTGDDDGCKNTATLTKQ